MELGSIIENCLAFDIEGNILSGSVTLLCLSVKNPNTQFDNLSGFFKLLELIVSILLYVTREPSALSFTTTSCGRPALFDCFGGSFSYFPTCQPQSSVGLNLIFPA